MTDREPFRTRIKVRHYELDTLGHLNHAVYHSYGEVARLELFEAAGGLEGFMKAKLAAVLLETHVVFRRELRAGDVVDVTCEVKFGSGKTFKMDSNVIKVDGTLAAEISCTLGLMDLERRKLVADPRVRFEAAGSDLKRLSPAE
ncbi:acyl-CoA thioesterase [Amycolatopsis sp. NPDC051045]|uniref:acyl-CoA thioesterase n=1 Tax=Amycolatopsis sp. NPDC051045 TaxID=3156922 RepID=UPI00343F44ED